MKDCWVELSFSEFFNHSNLIFLISPGCFTFLGSLFSWMHPYTLVTCNLLSVILVKYLPNPNRLSFILYYNILSAILRKLRFPCLPSLDFFLRNLNIIMFIRLLLLFVWLQEWYFFYCQHHSVFNNIWFWHSSLCFPYKVLFPINVVYSIIHGFVFQFS